MHAVAPKQEECFGASCILIPTVPTFHNNIIQKFHWSAISTVSVAPP